MKPLAIAVWAGFVWLIEGVSADLAGGAVFSKVSKATQTEWLIVRFAQSA